MEIIGSTIYVRLCCKIIIEVLSINEAGHIKSKTEPHPAWSFPNTADLLGKDKEHRANAVPTLVVRLPPAKDWGVA